MGTPNYMSPEQWESAHDVGPATDQWAVGAILYELLTGAPAFGGTELGPLCAKITMQSPTPPRTLRPDIPEQIERAVLQTLAKEPSDRFPSLFEFAQAIAPFGSRGARMTLQRIGGVLRPGAPLDPPAGAGGPAPPAGPAVAPQAQESTPTLAAQTAAEAIGTLPTAPAWNVDLATSPKPRVSPIVSVAIVGVLVILSFIGLIALLWSDEDPPEQLPGADRSAAAEDPAAPSEPAAPEPAPDTMPSGSSEASQSPTGEPTADSTAPPPQRPRRPPTGKPPAKRPVDLFGRRH
jgi:serine/threonine-protein kinase